MTLVFRNRLDPDNGRQIGLPVVSVTTVAALKSALLTAGTYTVSPGLYVADLVANVDDVHLICLPGVIFRPLTSAVAALRILANHFSITGTWQVDVGYQIGFEIGSTTATTQDAQPDDVLLDGGTFLPFYIATTGTQGTGRGMGCHGSHVTISNCRFENFWKSGIETQAIWIHNTNGPVTITDCFIEGAGENIMYGGSDFGIPLATPSDCYFARNTVYKRPSWRPASEGVPGVTPDSPLRTVKNSFELKNAQRIIIEDNVIDGCWHQSQNGHPIVFTVRNSGTAAWYWVIVNDVIFRHNIIRNCFSAGSYGVNILGHDDEGRNSQQTRNIEVSNNLFEDQEGGVQVSQGVTDLLLIDHNTFVGDTNAAIVLFANTAIKTALRLTNNAGQEGAYGVNTSGVTATVAAAVAAACSSSTITGNVWGRNKTQNPTWPAGNVVVQTPGIVFTGPPDYQITGAQAGADAGWDGITAGVGIHHDGTSP